MNYFWRRFAFWLFFSAVLFLLLPRRATFQGDYSHMSSFGFALRGAAVVVLAVGAAAGIAGVQVWIAARKSVRAHSNEPDRQKIGLD